MAEQAASQRNAGRADPRRGRAVPGPRQAQLAQLQARLNGASVAAGATGAAVAQATSDADMQTSAGPGGSRVARLTQLAAGFNGAAVARMPTVLSPPAGSGAAPIQRKLVDAGVRGISHLVVMQGGGLLAANVTANEGPEIKAGDTVQIDDARVHVSRRGPNQETHAEADKAGPAQYVWYLATKVNGTEAAKDSFARADALALGGVAPKLRAEDAEHLDYPLPAYMAGQQAYQSRLAQEGQTSSSVTAAHRSVGFEFEFGAYTGAELSSHVELAKSTPFSPLFNLPFVLETDSGSVLEVGFPPLLFRNRPGGGPNTASISLIYHKAKAQMDRIGRKQGLTIAEVCAELAKTVSHVTWTLMPAAQELRTGDKSQVEKFKGEGVYSQLNISLTAQESAALIGRMSQPDILPGTAEKGVLGERYNTILGALKGTTPDAAKIHLAKSYANYAAAFDISPATRHLAGPDEVSSTVKELHGVWVKDAPHNILDPFADRIDPRDVEQAATDAHGWADRQSEALRERTGPSEGPELARSIAAGYNGEYTRGALHGLVERVEKVLPGGDAAELRAWINKLEAALTSGERLVEEGKDDDTAYAEFYTLHGDFAPYIERLQSKAASKKDHLGTTLAEIHADIDAMSDKIKTRAGLSAPDGTKFGEERFGTGTGVRKDTYLPSLTGSAQHPPMSVAELRSGYVINKFLEQS